MCSYVLLRACQMKKKNDQGFLSLLIPLINMNMLLNPGIAAVLLHKMHCDITCSHFITAFSTFWRILWYSSINVLECVRIVVMGQPKKLERCNLFPLPIWNASIFMKSNLTYRNDSTRSGTGRSGNYWVMQPADA